MDFGDYKKLVMLVPSVKISDTTDLTIEALRKSFDVFKNISSMTFKSGTFPNTTFLEISPELFDFCLIELQLEMGSFEADKYIKEVVEDNIVILVLDFETFALNIKSSREKIDKSIEGFVSQLNLATDYKEYVEKLEQNFANPILEG